MTALISDRQSTKKSTAQPNYKTPNYHQDTLLSISPKDQIQPGTFEYAIQYLLDEKLDLSLFDSRYNNSGTGRKAYPPSVLLKIILLAYSMGATSSRTMERLCRVHVTFMAISGFSAPDHSTLAAFVSSLENEIVDLFMQVLMICDQQGLIGKHLFAIDGCKLPSNASKESSGTHEELKRKSHKMRTAVQNLLTKHQDQDNDDEDETIQHHEQKQIDTLNAQADRIDEFLSQNEPRIGSQGKEVKSNITDNDSAKMQTSHGAIQGYNGIATADSKHQIIMQAEAIGQGSEQSILQPSIEQLQETLAELDPTTSKEDSLNNSILLADSGYHSEANLETLSDNNIDAYIADNQFRKRDPKFKDAERFKTTKHGKRPTAKLKKYQHQDFDYDPNTQTCICPAGKIMWLISENTLKVHNSLSYRFRGHEQDCRNCELRARCLQKTDQKTPRQLSIPVSRVQPEPSHTQKMIKKIDTDQGRKTYSQRLGIIEPVFGNIRTTKRLARLSLRGKSKVDTQWKLVS